MKVSPCAGKPAEASMLVNVPKLVTAYYTEAPDPSEPGQRVAFGTSGHRGSAFENAFNEWHILAISPAKRGRMKYDAGRRQPLRIKRSCWRESHPSGLSSPSWRAKESKPSSPTRRATVRPSAGCKSWPRADGLWGVHQGPRISTRSMQRASGERIICCASWRKPRRLSAML
jgi:hypothetical protein